MNKARISQAELRRRALLRRAPSGLFVSNLHIHKRYCIKCGRKNTPQWRMHENGDLLCNACGCRHRRDTRNKFKTSTDSHTLNVNAFLTDVDRISAK